MSSKSKAKTKTLSLKSPVVLYVDATRRSKQAEQLLIKAGIQPYITSGAVEPREQKPLVVFAGAVYQGLDGIQGFLNLLEHWRRQPIKRSIFSGA